MCIKKDILATLAYFNLFDYPLRKRELLAFIGHTDELHEFEEALDTLAEESIIFKVDDFYCLYNNHEFVERRYKGNKKAGRMLKKAAKAAAIIAAFPFVKGVAVSGSLSKKFADDTSDIDFFIITAANRLWLTRTFLHAFKKLTYLVNMQHFFCMNYFVDEAGLNILEKNIYTATEIVTVLPLQGSEAFKKFYAANSWVKKFLPNSHIHLFPAREIRKAWFKYIPEKILDNRVGDLLDTALMKLTGKSWDLKRRRKKLNRKGWVMSLHTGKHFSKPDPENFQKRLLQRYEKSLAEVFERHELCLGVRHESL